MPGLLGIPAELLDSIIEFILLGGQHPPATLEEAQQTRLGVHVKPQPFTKNVTKNVLYGGSVIVSNAAPLLRTNRQLSAKTRQAMSRLFPEGPRYKLDVMVVDDIQLWPTWLSVPYLTDQVQSVEVTFRVFGPITSNDRNSSTCGIDARKTIAWCLYFLLEHFLEYGPYPSTSNRSLEAQQSHHITVKTIDLRFQPGDLARLPATDSRELQRAWNMHQRAWRNYQRNGGNSDAPNDIGFSIHPTWLAEHALSQINFLLGMSYHATPYGMLLHNRVGQFLLSTPPDSRFQGAQVVVHEVLGGLSAEPDNLLNEGYVYTNRTMGHLWGDCRVFSFWNWKWKTIQERREHGLGVPSNVTWPSRERWVRWKEVRDAGAHNNSRKCLCFETGLESWLESEAPVE